MNRWIVVPIVFILSIGFTVMMDLLLGFTPDMALKSILLPFRVMVKAETVVIALLIFIVAALEIMHARQG
ncbi:hypothetical protein [Cohnella sp.]|uniref:hypothetical protein n=1 Tax=Cohnella sp. TaxID=1883426 RepID=UPI00356397E1